MWVLLGHYTPLKHVRCNPDVAPRLTSGGYEDKVDVITPINMFIPHEDKVDVIAPINILFRGGGKIRPLMKIKLMLLPQSTYCSEGVANFNVMVMMMVMMTMIMMMMMTMMMTMTTTMTMTMTTTIVGVEQHSYDSCGEDVFSTRPNSINSWITGALINDDILSPWLVGQGSKGGDDLADLDLRTFCGSWDQKRICPVIPSGKRLHNYGKSPFSMGKSTINGHVQ